MKPSILPRRTILTIWGLLCALATMSSSPSAGEDDSLDACLKIEKRGINLGDVSSSSDVKKFSFTGVNTGNAPLVLTYVHPSCNCVRLKYPREPIAPGDTLQIRGTFNPHGLSSGPFKRDIIVRSNASEPKIRLIITGSIMPDTL